MTTFRARIFKYFTGITPEQLKSVQQQSEAIQTVSSSSDLYETYLFDFRNLDNSFHDGMSVPSIDSGNPSDQPKAKHKDKIKVKPVDVLHELEVVPTTWDLILIDEKISMLQEKSKLINQEYAKREITGLMERLENRKQYMDHKSFFEGFENTTDEKIEALLGKYDLVMKGSDIFIPEFPDEAIKIMKLYSLKVKEICGKLPVFSVIAPPSMFKKAYKKRDPILLVQSPFGFYWQILGAWDEEMILLSEL